MGKIQFWMSQIERYEKLIKESTKYGKDIYVEGTVIKFRKQFVEGGAKYRYAAIKAGGLWYTTGPKAPKGYTWEEFCIWLNQGVPVKKLWLMTNKEDILEEERRLDGADSKETDYVGPYAEADVQLSLDMLNLGSSEGSDD